MKYCKKNHKKLENNIYKIYKEKHTHDANNSTSVTVAIMMKFSGDRDVGILYITTKFERPTDNGDQLSDRKKWKDTQTHIITHTNSHTD